MPAKNCIEVPCGNCGKPLRRPQYRVKRNAHHFCDPSCKREFQTNKPNLAHRRQVQLTCEYCGKLYSKPQAAAVGSRFCCVKCRNEADTLITGSRSPHYKSVEVPCSQCGKVLTRIPTRIKNQTHHFCNHACKAQWQKFNQRGDQNPSYKNGGYPVACAQCGMTFTVNAWKFKHRKNNFCSQSCYWRWKPENHSGENSPSWKGGPVDYYGPNWNVQRQKARKRDSYRCQCCNVTESELGRELDIHHLIPFRVFGVDNYRAANHLSNLISLCASCHTRAEHGKIALQPRLL